MEIVIRKKSKEEWLTLFILAMPFFFSLLIDLLYLPDTVRFSLDIAWIGLLLCMLNKKKMYFTKLEKIPAIVIGVFFAITLIGFLTHFQSFLYYAWGLRNNVRFFIFFFSCIFFLNKKSLKAYLAFFDVMFWINIPVVLVQYFLLDKKQDYLGGIFGVNRGCNGYMNLFLIIVLTKSIIMYLNKKEGALSCYSKCVAALVVVVLSELKVFFFELVVIILMAMGFTKFSWRKIWITIGIILGITVGVEMIKVLFPDFVNWFSFDRIWKSVTKESGYSGGNGMNRLTVISIAMNNLLPSMLEKCFGLGMGNCDYGSFDFLITPFYQMYGGMNYTAFSSAFLVLETGLVGLILYVAFFCVIFLCIRKLPHDEEGKIYIQMTEIYIAMSIIQLIYNSAMRVEAGYMMFFALSVPFIYARNPGGAERAAIE